MLIATLGSARVTQVVPVLTVGRDPREQHSVAGLESLRRGHCEVVISGVVEAPGLKVSWFGTVWQGQSL